MSDLNEILDPFEKIVWKGKANKYIYFLPAIGSILFAGFLFSIGVFLFLINLPELSSFFALIFCGFGILIVIIPFRHYLRKNKYTRYILTDRRLIITGFGKNSRFWDNFGHGLSGVDTSIIKLDSIKDVYLKKGFWDRLIGTKSIYPITLDYPYLPKIYAYFSNSEHESGFYSNRLKRVYNAATKEYEMVPQWKLYRKTQNHPHFSGISNPQKVERLIRERINEV